jgi:polysaccharide pyruvyl transferase WcaK-like protein
MMDRLLTTWVSGQIERSRLSGMLRDHVGWKPDQPLRLLFAGYNGTRNTGADVRVHEMLRQIEHILGPDRVEMTVLTQDFKKTTGYFGNARQIRLPDIFPPFLRRQVPRYEGVVACEGSMFKSKFANALTTMMIGALGMAAARNRLSVGYGAEAGHMDPSVRRMARRYCKQTLVITRNEQSLGILRKLGIPTELGTDTAWTFEPHGPEYGRNALRQAGWNGSDPVLIVCPINPFWWPVKPSLLKSATRMLFGGYKKSHYRSIYFHRSGAQVAADYQRYLEAIAGAVRSFSERHPVFPVMVAMEALDTSACHAVSKMLDRVPVISAQHYDMYELVSILRCANMLVSSRYHALVTSMPGAVPSGGVTMDERIANLMTQRGHEHLLLTVDDPDLENRLVEMLETLHREPDAVRAGIGRTVAHNLKEMARMGVYFEQHVQKRYPQFEIRNGIHKWDQYLPPIGPTLRGILEEHST